MSAKRELWVARDPDGDLFAYVGAPKMTTRDGFKEWGNHLHCTCLGELDSSLYPQVKNGKRVRLVLDVITLTGK